MTRSFVSEAFQRIGHPFQRCRAGPAAHNGAAGSAFPGVFEWDPDVWRAYLDNLPEARQPVRRTEARRSAGTACVGSLDTCMGMCAL